MKPIDSRPANVLSEYQISKILKRYNITDVFTQPYLQIEMDGNDLKNIIAEVVDAAAKKLLGQAKKS